MPVKTALVLLHDGVEEMEFVAPVDILRRGDVAVTVASTAKGLVATGRSGLQIKADTLLTDALYPANAVWDALVIPGGPGVGALRKNPLVLEAVRRHKGRIVSAICAAPLILLDAGLLTADGSAAPYTAHPATLSELPVADASQDVITATIPAPAAADNAQAAADHGGDTTAATSATTCLITSRGAGTATAFALTVLAEVTGGQTGRELANTVAASICLGATQ